MIYYAHIIYYAYIYIVHIPKFAFSTECLLPRKCSGSGGSASSTWLQANSKAILSLISPSSNLVQGLFKASFF